MLWYYNVACKIIESLPITLSQAQVAHLVSNTIESLVAIQQKIKLRNTGQYFEVSLETEFSFLMHLHKRCAQLRSSEMVERQQLQDLIVMSFIGATKASEEYPFYLNDYMIKGFPYDIATLKKMEIDHFVSLNFTSTIDRDFLKNHLLSLIDENDWSEIRAGTSYRTKKGIEIFFGNKGETEDFWNFVKPPEVTPEKKGKEEDVITSAEELNAQKNTAEPKTSTVLTKEKNAQKKSLNVLDEAWNGIKNKFKSLADSFSKLTIKESKIKDVIFDGLDDDDEFFFKTDSTYSKLDFIDDGFTNDLKNMIKSMNHYTKDSKDTAQFDKFTYAEAQAYLIKRLPQLNPFTLVNIYFDLKKNQTLNETLFDVYLKKYVSIEVNAEVNLVIQAQKSSPSPESIVVKYEINQMNETFEDFEEFEDEDVFYKITYK